MNINRVWAMPNKRTFQIKPIGRLIHSEVETPIDPFPFPYKKDAMEYMGEFQDASVTELLFDPPYSPRQLKECYNSLGQSLTQYDTSNATWRKWKDEIARIVAPNGKVISFGWNSNGIGKNRGFKIEKILLVAHGGNHNDTICVVERKIDRRLNVF